MRWAFRIFENVKGKVVLAKSFAESVCFSTPHNVALASRILTKFLASAIDSLVGSVSSLLSVSAPIFVEPLYK